MKNPTRNLDWRLLVLILPPLSLLVYVSLSPLISSSSSSSSALVFNPFSSFAPVRSFFSSSATWPTLKLPTQEEKSNGSSRSTTMAVCLVGGARRFELTGPSIIQKILKVYPHADLFLHSPLDSNAYKFSLLKAAPRIASVRIFRPKPINETEEQLRVLTAHNSPNGIQGLLQYFHLVEGCITTIKAYQDKNNFTYDWIVRTRVDGYWSGPLRPDNLVPGYYVVPPGSSYGGLNDRFGAGDFNTSVVALSRLSLIPQLDSAGFLQLNSESAFKAQLMTQKVPYITKRLPFCIVTDRKYDFPPGRFGVPVAAMSSRGLMSGAKCRPCKPVCTGPCVGPIMSRLERGWSWTDWANDSLQLCDAHAEWEDGWEEVFDGLAGKKLAAARKRIWALKMDQCVSDFEKMRNKTAHWEAPSSANICKLGLGPR